MGPLRMLQLFMAERLNVYLSHTIIIVTVLLCYMLGIHRTKLQVTQK